MVEKQLRAALKDWILDRTSAPPAALSDDQQPILDGGLLSSLDVVEFILFIEDLREEEVDLEAIEPEAFNNIDSLMTAFFPAAKKEAAA